MIKNLLIPHDKNLDIDICEQEFGTDKFKKFRVDRKTLDPGGSVPTSLDFPKIYHTHGVS